MSTFVAEDYSSSRHVPVEAQLTENTERLCLSNDFIQFFNQESQGGLARLIASLLSACDIIGYNLRNNEYRSQEVGTVNSFGDSQLDIDIKCDDLIFKTLKLSKLVALASSEEKPIEVNCDGTGFCVSFDPLDGSSIVDANFAVGSIFGIWEGDQSFLRRTGREQNAAMIVQYGPRLTAMVGLSGKVTATGQPITFELTHTAHHGWIVSVPQVIIQPTSKIFAPGNLRAITENTKYQNLVHYWMDNKYTLRYSGGLVPDVYHIFIKKNGVLSNASSKSAKAKLRLIYECAPIALIMESAGGFSCVCPSEVNEKIEPISILDVVVDDLDKRIGVCYGSRDEVERFKSYIFST
jgi:sedoheptulose-bisphosphatase